MQVSEDNASGNPAAAFDVDVINVAIGGLGSPPGYPPFGEQFLSVCVDPSK